MNCPFCQHKNRETANFCMNCGKRIIIECSNCGTRLPISANYCDHCGTPVQKTFQPDQASSRIAQVEKIEAEIIEPPISLNTKDTTIQTDQMLSRYIPQELVKKLHAARSEGRMVGERRVVTMLFCDVMGSTAAAEQLDPEDWTEVINKAFEYMIKPVYKYEGLVARLMGDAILAFFGAPIAHEDDPRRAALAGLDIISGIQPLRVQISEQYGIDFNVRVGINTGTVVVGAVGSDMRMEYTALGDAVNVASRMETAAQPGTILVSEVTRRLIEPYFEFEDPEEIEVKGKAEPIKCYRIIGRKRDSNRFAGIGGVRVEMVGREEELTQLQEVLEQAREGVGRILSVVGEAGLGKSRLIDEGLAGWRSAQDTCTYQIECLSYEHIQAYISIRRLFQRLMAVRTDEDPHKQHKKLGMFVSKLDAEQQPSAKRMLQTLFGFELDTRIEALEGEEFKRELYNQSENILMRLISQLPTVMVFEDIHWCDLASIELLQHLLPLVEKLPLVMIFSFRPDRSAPSWALKQTVDEDFYHRYTEIRLGVLPETECKLLINRLLGDTDIPQSLQEKIIERAGGNPFFIEEVLRTLIDNRTIIAEEEQTGEGKQLHWHASPGAVQVTIPENLQSLLTARIDLLDEDVHQTMQLASVIGRRFNERVLKALANGQPDTPNPIDMHLRKLLQLEMIDEAARQPEVEYNFRNPLIQETAYRSVLRKRRTELHLQVARALEELYPQQLSELAPQLGFHFNQGKDHKKALAYYTAAGDSAYRLYANALAVTHYETALEQAKTFPEQAWEEMLYLYNRAGRALELESRFREAIGLYEDELAMGSDLGQPALELQALISLGTVYSMPSDQSDSTKAESLSRKALKLAEEMENKDAQARILWNLMNMYRLELRAEEGVSAGERGLALALESGNDEITAYIYNDLSYVYLGVLDTQNAYRVTNQAIKRWRELNNQPMLVDCLSSASSILIYLGKYDEAIIASDEAARISRSINNPWGIGFSRNYIGSVYEDRGDISQALRDYEIAYKMGVESGFFVGEIWGQVRLAHLYIELNDLEKAKEYIDRVKEQYRDYSGLQGMFASMIELEQVALYITIGDLQKAKNIFDSTDFDNAETYIYTREYIYEIQARLLLALEDYKEARRFCKERIDNLQELGNKSMLYQMYLFLGCAHLKLGEFEQAEAALRKAFNIADELGARWSLWQILAVQADLAERQGAGERAKGYRDRAIEVIEYVSAKIEQADLRESFLRREDVASMLAYQS